MNERIREFATEVGISVEYLTNTKQIVLIDKFAELIVRDCLRICEEGTATQTTSAGAADLIKQHFGVEP